MDKMNKESLANSLMSIVDALSCIVGKNIEVVIHDLTNPNHSIIKILNGHLSGRKEGDSVLNIPDHDLGSIGLLVDQNKNVSNPQVFKGYETKVAGRIFTSSTVIYKDENQQPIFAMCFNADQKILETAKNLLSQLLPRDESLGVEESEHTLQKKIAEIIHFALPQHNLLNTKRSKAEKIEIVKVMQTQGLFLVRGGVEAAANALGVTRYTIYNYLEEIKTKPI